MKYLVAFVCSLLAGTASAQDLGYTVVPEQSRITIMHPKDEFTWTEVPITEGGLKLVFDELPTEGMLNIDFTQAYSPDPHGRNHYWRAARS